MKYTFVDEATLLVRSGNGGPGCVSFRREKHVEYGGPDGGNGGRGGDVVIQVDSQLTTLLDYRYRPQHIAPNGQPGEGNQKTGRDGEHVVLRVPTGTVVFDADTDQLVADLDMPDAQITVAKGGRGGKGNEHFKRATRQAPRYAQPGEAGEELNLRLELKLLANVGLVGMPSVGKSSLIARMSAARPKIADYPFTTLVPNLGVVKVNAIESYVVADVPGLIVGAHHGAGLGAQFLRHIERVGCIAHLVTVVEEEPGREPLADYEAIEREIELHDADLTQIQRVVVLNRIDLPFVREAMDDVRAYAADKGLAFFAISAATGEGIQALIYHLGEMVKESQRLDSQMP